MRRVLPALLGVLGVLGLVIGINVLAETRLANAHLDLTGQHLYSVSKGTRRILGDLRDPVTLRLFFSRRLGTAVPLYATYHDRVLAMLRQYATLSRGKLRVETLEPEPFSDTEDRALGYGLQAVPIDQSGEEVYFGLVGTNALDDQRAIAFLSPDRERFLEYDLTRLVYELSNPARPTLGVMSALPLEGDPRAMMLAMRTGQTNAGGPWQSLVLLRESNTIKTVPLDTPVIDPSINVLLVAQAPNLSDATLYAIDQFVMRGGRLMAMVDPKSESAGGGGMGEPPEAKSSTLTKLFDAWGITFDPSTVIGDLSGAWRVRASATDRTGVVDYVPWFNITDGIAKDDPATADLTQVTVASAGAIGRKDGADIAFTPLLTSSPKSGLVPVEDVEIPDPEHVLSVFHPDGTPRVVAARVRGVLHSAFKEAPPTPDGKPRSEDFPAFRDHTDGPANLVVAGDSDILADRFWVRTQDFFGQQQATPFSDNGAFVANLIGTLSGSDALLGLRAKGESVRPFTRVAEMQAAADTRFRQTEQTLRQHLTETEKQLTDLRQGKPGETETLLTPDQEKAVDAARDEILSTRKQLRAVQLDLRRDISRLQTEVEVADIAVVPALLAVGAVVFAVARARRRAAARA